MARHRLDDTRSAGRSRLVPFRAGEDASNRHARRLKTNLADGRAAVEAWCADKGIALAIKNDGHHWIFKRGEWVAEWWPSSAKLVIGRQYGKGIHVHDWQQAMRIMERRLPRN